MDSKCSSLVFQSYIEGWIFLPRFGNLVPWILQFWPESLVKYSTTCLSLWLCTPPASARNFSCRAGDNGVPSFRPPEMNCKFLPAVQRSKSRFILFNVHRHRQQGHQQHWKWAGPVPLHHWNSPRVLLGCCVVSQSNHFPVSFAAMSFLFPDWHLCSKRKCLEFGSKFPNVGQADSYFLEWASFHFQLTICSCQMLTWPFCLTGLWCA